MMRRTFVFALCALIFCNSAEAKFQDGAAFDAMMRDGREYYRQKAFCTARSTFEDAVSERPMSQDAHFWLAMSHWNLRDYDATCDELELVFRLNPFSAEGQAAKNQLPEIMSYIQHERQPVVDSRRVVETAITATGRQAGDLIQNKIDDGMRTALAREDLAAREADRIRDENRWFRRIGRQGYAGLPNYQGEVSDIGLIRSNYTLTDGRRMAIQSMTDARNRAAAIREWQQYILNGLAEPPSADKPQLRALGTNLYVQNYDKNSGRYIPEPPAEAPLQATALSMQHLQRVSK